MVQKTLFDDNKIETKSSASEIVVTPKAQKTIRILWMDGGERKNYVKVFDTATMKEYNVKFEDYLNIPLQDNFEGVPFADYDIVYVGSELPHLVLALEYSLAQIFDEQQQTDFINAVNNSKNIVMVAWSEKMTTTALKLFKRPDGKDGLKDVDDCAAICNYIEYHNYYGNLKRIRCIDDLKPDDTITAGNEYRAEHWNKDINRAQKVNYGLPKKQGFLQDYDLCPVMRDIILPNWEYLENDLPTELQKLWKINLWKELYEKEKTLANYPDEHTEITQHRHLIKVKKRKQDSKNGDFKKGDIDIEDWIPEMRGLYSAFNGIFDYEGELRKHPLNEGEYMSMGWLHDHYMVDKQHHQKGGVGRAIHYHYIFPPYVQKLWDEIHGDGDWPAYSCTYDNPHYGTDEKTKAKQGKKKRNNRGSLTREQGNFLVENRADIRQKIRDHIWKLFIEKYS